MPECHTEVHAARHDAASSSGGAAPASGPNTPKPVESWTKRRQRSQAARKNWDCSRQEARYSTGVGPRRRKGEGLRRSPSHTTSKSIAQRNQAQSWPRGAPSRQFQPKSPQSRTRPLNTENASTARRRRKQGTVRSDGDCFNP